MIKQNTNRYLKHLLLGTAICAMTFTTACHSTDADAVDHSTKVSASAKEKTDKKNHSLFQGEIWSLPLDKQEILSCKGTHAEVAEVSDQGQIHALKEGTSTVTVKLKKEQETQLLTYHIQVKKRGMVYPSFTMMKGETLPLQFSSSPGRVTWTSKQTKKVRVTKKGNVTGLKTGKAIITGTDKNGHIYQCNLTIKPKIKSVIYLTFDDGPNRYTTPKILKVLRKNKVNATFFELKPSVKDFDLTKQVLRDGNTLALHGYAHKYNIVYRSQKVYHNNLDKLRNLFFKKYGVWCTLSRFPGGSSNTCSRYNPKIMTKLTKDLPKWGYHYFDWNVDSMDAGGARSAKDTFRNFKRGILKNRSNVVLMHDFYKNDKTINALDKMIRYGKKHGFTFLPLTASTEQVHHQVNN